MNPIVNTLLDINKGMAEGIPSKMRMWDISNKQALKVF